MEPNSQENIPQRREHPQKCFTLRNTTIRTQTQVLPRKTSCTDTFPSVWRQIGLLPLTPLTTGSSDWLEPQKITFCILFKKKKIFPSNLIGASILPSWNLFFHVLAVLLRFPKLVNLGYTGLAFHFKNIFFSILLYFPAPSRYNWQKLYIFKTCNLMIWYKHTLWNIHHNQVN